MPWAHKVGRRGQRLVRTTARRQDHAMTASLAPNDLHALAQHHARTPGGLLPCLHDIQDRLGFIPPESLDTLAQAFNRSRAEVHGVVSYYHHFRTTPPGRHVLQICRAEACQACGGEALAALAERVLGCAEGETSRTGVSLESVYCLGLCASSPAIAIDGQPRARIGSAQLQDLLQKMGAQA